MEGLNDNDEQSIEKDMQDDDIHKILDHLKDIGDIE